MYGQHWVLPLGLQHAAGPFCTSTGKHIQNLGLGDRVIQETFIHCKGVRVEIWAKARTCNLFPSLVVEHAQNHS